jgi:hypothetical protein
MRLSVGIYKQNTRNVMSNRVASWIVVVLIVAGVILSIEYRETFFTAIILIFLGVFARIGIQTCLDDERDRR